MSEKGPENEPVETMEPTEETKAASETTGARSSGELARPLAPSEGVTARSADADRVPEASRWHLAMREITTGNALVAVLSVLLALGLAG